MEINDLDRKLREHYRKEIHSIRSDLTAIANWGLEDLLIRWDELSENEKRVEIEHVKKTIQRVINSSLRIEGMVTSWTSPEGKIGPALRRTVEDWGLTKCSKFEGLIDDYIFEDLDVAGQLFYFGQEAITNVGRHSRIDRDSPNQVTLRLEIQNDLATLSVSDRGVGLQRELHPNDFEQLRGSIEEGNGKVDIMPNPDKQGLLVIATVPLKMPRRKSLLQISSRSG